MKKTKLAWMGGVLALIVIGGLAAARSGDKGLPVQVADVNRETIQAKVSANGKIQAVKKVDISANTMGQVTRLAVKEGDAVKQGQFLLEIDPRSARASTDAMQAAVHAALSDLATAQANLVQAKADFDRAKANRDAGIISASDYEKAKTSYDTAKSTVDGLHQRADQAKAQLSQSHVGLGYSTITAPMDGVVTAKRIEQGENAVIGIQNSPGTVLLTISDMSKVEAEMEVDEASIPAVKLGQSAVVHIDAYPNQSFQAVVTEVGGSPILKANTNEAIKFLVKVQIKNPPYTIKPGLSAEADIYTGRRDDVLAVPIQSLVTRDVKLKPGEKPDPAAPKEEEGVYLMDAGKSRFVTVKTGLMGDLNVEVTEGLKGGEKVITGPFRVLREMKGGEQVRAEKPKKKAPEQAS